MAKETAVEPIRKINEELSIAGQISTAQLPQLVQEGFRSLLNLRSPIEVTFLVDEQEKAESLGLNYVNLPLGVKEMSDASIAHTLQQMNKLPKPLLVHCDNAVCAAAIALIYIAVRQGSPVEKALQQVQQLGLLEAV